MAYLSANFRCAWKKVGTFTVVEDRGTVVEKRGGSVAAYFTTPEGRVLGASLGATNAEHFLDETKWAVALAGKIRGIPEAERESRAATAHAAKSAKPLRGPEGVFS